MDDIESCALSGISRRKSDNRRSRRRKRRRRRRSSKSRHIGCERLKRQHDTINACQTACYGTRGPKINDYKVMRLV